MLQDSINMLNPEQRTAVLTTEGPLLLLAGAGSGKTRVLTHRIAYLIEKGVRPFNILAITFTNKAAREMKERVEKISDRGSEVWVSTFHSTCVRLLRREIDKIGFSNNFSIYDASDSERLIKHILSDMDISEKQYPVKMTAAEIGSQKDNLITPDEYANIVEKDFRRKKIADVYFEYQRRLASNNALDFDDLIFKTVMLFKERPDILEKYQDRFKYIMVDEYQDTNTSQYQLVKLLAAKHKNLCVVGDDDQSIYGWRGANIRNILDFENDFENTKVIKLEQNYRSTGTILNAANSVIKNNRTRKSKRLWTDQGDGERVRYYQATSDRSEAYFICDEIEKAVEEGKAYSDIAILYRNNSLSRALEESLITQKIPYRIFGGTRFYERKEIKDVAAYLKTINNPDDEIAVKRIINVPKRGIGETTISKVDAYAAQNGLSFYEALCECDKIEGLTSRVLNPISDFCGIINDMRAEAEELSASEVIEKILEKTLYKKELELENTADSQNRLENIAEFLNKAKQFEEQNPEDTSLNAFLQEVSLVADVDAYTEDQDTVVLMTLHSSKGLEFPVVFIAGFEESVFPGFRSIMEGAESIKMEEERRLCYVGITRAKEILYLTCAKNRMMNGQHVYNMPSRFLKEIPKDYINEIIIQKAAEQIGFGSEAYKIKADFYTQKPAKAMPAPKDFHPEYEVGDKVRHIKFGIGDVVDIKPAGADYEVTVDFGKLGKKKLMAKLMGLKKI